MLTPTSQTFDEWLIERFPTWRWDWEYEKLIGSYLDKVTTGEIKRLMLSLPPRHGKSEKVTIRYPVYRMERQPGVRICVGAYNQDFSERFSRFTRRIAEKTMPLSRERSAVKEWETAAGSIYRACGVGSPPTGEGFDLIIIDDPIKSRVEAESEAYRRNCFDWYSTDLYTRLEPQAAVILIQTRWHELDLAGQILVNEEGEQWTVVNLPALAIAGEPDPLNRAPGQALCPERYDEEALERIRLTLGSYSFNALYQGRPVAAEGNLFKTDWWRWYTADQAHADRLNADAGRVIAVVKPDTFDMVAQSWDMAFKDSDQSDFVAGGAVGVAGKRKYLLDVMRARADMVASVAMMRAMHERHPATMFTLVEDKANGPAVISTLQDEIEGLWAVNPEGGKLARAMAASPQAEAGEWFLPHPTIATWDVEGFIKEMGSFPNGAHDDQVDMWSQLALKLRQYRVSDEQESDEAKAKREEGEEWTALMARSGKADANPRGIGDPW